MVGIGDNTLRIGDKLVRTGDNGKKVVSGQDVEVGFQLKTGESVVKCLESVVTTGVSVVKCLEPVVNPSESVVTAHEPVITGKLPIIKHNLL